MQQLTEKDFSIFKEEAKKWIDTFGLKDWDVTFDFSLLENSRAECCVNWHGKAALITLGQFPRGEMTQEDVRKSAFHEVCELLLSDMEFTALNEEILHAERKLMTEVARHAVIRRMENSIFKNHYPCLPTIRQN